MNYPILRSFALVAFIGLSTTATAENHVEQLDDGLVKYGSDDCNNDPGYMSENNILCAAIFSDTSVGDYLNSLPGRVTLSMFAELNPRLGTIDHNTVIKGITILKVR